MRPPALLIAGVLLVSACGASTVPEPEGTLEPEQADVPGDPALWPAVPTIPPGPATAAEVAALDRLVGSVVAGSLDADALATVAASGDPRIGWILSDILRFLPPGAAEQSVLDAFERLTGTDPRADERFGANGWLAVTNLMLGWDLPEPTAYREHKAAMYLRVEPKWTPFFADADAAIDWRWISWGGVLIDDRPSGDPNPCVDGCIPALDDPELTPVSAGDWYTDDRPIFGIVIDDEAVAFPRHIMEVHELANVTVAGQRIGIPYCTLCGSAHAYLLDPGATGTEPIVLRTSGLLSRSNKVMYDLHSGSAFNTFTGRAVSGPLHDAGLVLEQVTVVVTTWGAWKEAHPGTRIVAQDGGIGRTYPDDPLGGRDDAGPIFPVGQVDPRLPAQSQVLGVIGHDGRPIAFPADQARAALADGEPVSVGGVTVTSDGEGLRAHGPDGDELAAHQSFWFAWSQFHPDTGLWSTLRGPSAPSPGDPSRPAASTSPRDAFAARMCPALAGLAVLDDQLSALRDGPGDDDAISSTLAALSVARASFAGIPRWPAGVVFQRALLDSLDSIGAAIRDARSLPRHQRAAALAGLPFITTDAVERALQATMSKGFGC